MYNLKDLKVWSNAVKLLYDVFQIIDAIPNKDEYWIFSKIKRNVLAISSAIAGGTDPNRNFCYHLNGSLGSVHELRILIHLSCNLQQMEKIKGNVLRVSIIETQKMIEDLIKSTRKG